MSINTQPERPRDGEDPAGWKVTITGVTLTFYTDGPPICPDQQAALRQVGDKLRAASKTGLFFTIPQDYAFWRWERDQE